MDEKLPLSYFGHASEGVTFELTDGKLLSIGSAGQEFMHQTPYGTPLRHIRVPMKAVIEFVGEWIRHEEIRKLQKTDAETLVKAQLGPNPVEQLLEVLGTARVLALMIVKEGEKPGKDAYELSQRLYNEIRTLYSAVKHLERRLMGQR